MPSVNLPFPRGETYFGGDSSAATSVGVESLVGLEFLTYDGSYTGRDHTTNAPIVLKVLQNRSGGNLTGFRGVRLTTGATTYGKYAKGYGNAVGSPGVMPIDDAYGTTYAIINNDLFYVVQDGPCKIKCSTVAHTTIAVNDKLTWDVFGRVAKMGTTTGAAAAHAVVGLAQTGVAGAVTGTAVLVIVGGYGQA